MMTPIEMLALIVGVLIVPMIGAIVTSPKMSGNRKRVIVLAITGLLGLVSAVITGAIDGVPSSVVDWLVRILGWIVALIAGSQGIYALLKEPLKSLESKTSPAPADDSAYQPPERAQLDD